MINQTDPMPARMIDAISTMLDRSADDDAYIAFTDLLIDPNDSDAIASIPTIAALYRSFILPFPTYDRILLESHELCPMHRCDYRICIDDDPNFDPPCQRA